MLCCRWLFRRYGAWMMRAFGVLAKLRFLRGTPLDPFGRSAERRTERGLIDEYEAMLDELIAGLSPENHAVAVELATIPEQIRGFGHVKLANLATARTRQAELLAAFRSPSAPHAIAAE